MNPIEAFMPRIVVDPYENHWVDDISIEAYHEDRQAVSSSGVRRVVKSAASFRSYWIGENAVEDTEAMKFGRLAHLAILEPTRFLDAYVVEPEFTGLTLDGRPTKNPRSNDVAAKRAAWLMDLKPGSIVVTEEERTKLSGMTSAIIQHDDARLSLTNGKAEISGWYVDKETGILCRIRPDFLHFNGQTLIDIKTTKDCEAWSFSKDVYNRGYHIQMAMYAAGCEAITGVKVKHSTLIAVEKEPPFEVAVYKLDEAAMDLGTAMYRRGLRRLKESLTTGKWPKYQEIAQAISLPAYAFYDDSLAIG